MKKRFLIMLLCAVMLLSGTSCGKRLTLVSAEELSASYKRTATDGGAVTGDCKREMADFSMRLFNKAVTKDDKNDVISPISVIYCLGLIANGASGDTLSQMEEMLGMNLDELNQCMFAYTGSLYSSDKCKVTLENSLWIRDDFTVKSNFLQADADWYAADAFAAPFDDTTVTDINNWCNYKTDGMIDSIIKKLDPENVMLLINAVMFDAKWQDKYEKNDIVSGTFENYDGTEVSVSYLHSTESVYFENESASGFAKEYDGGAYSFVGLIPNEGVDVYDFAEGLNGETWLELWDSRQTGYEVTAIMPEFTYDADTGLNDILKAMGMTDAFSEVNADFSGISDEQTYLSEVKQKAYIRVDRNGTKAAAVTWGTVSKNAMPNFVRLDRPFVWAIVDNNTGLPIFIGIVTNL